MGDMADWIIENADLDVLYEYQGPKICRFCGAGNLEWANDTENRSWRLFDVDTGLIHICPKNPAPEHKIKKDE